MLLDRFFVPSSSTTISPRMSLTIFPVFRSSFTFSHFAANIFCWVGVLSSSSPIYVLAVSQVGYFRLPIKASKKIGRLNFPTLQACEIHGAQGVLSCERWAVTCERWGGKGCWFHTHLYPITVDFWHEMYEHSPWKYERGIEKIHIYFINVH